MKKVIRVLLVWIIIMTVPVAKEVEENTKTVSKYCLSFKKEGRGDDYEIDQFGKVISITSDYNDDGTSEKKVFNSYDKRGNLIRVITETYQELKQVAVEAGIVSGVDYYREIKYQTIPTERTEATYTYDKENRLLEKLKEFENHYIRRMYRYADKPEVTGVRVFLDNKLAWDYDIINSYDTEGRLSSMALKGLVNNSILIDIKNEHRNEAYIYNDKGQLTKRESLDKSWFYLYMYDTRGNRIKETLYQRNDKGIYRKRFSSIFYKYDDYGNMIEKSNDTGEISLKQRFHECMDR